MGQKEFDIDKLRDYLLGKLNEQEKASFEAMLNNDAEFKKDVTIHTALLAGIELHFDRHLKHRLQKEDKKIKVNTKVLLLALAACASAILIVSYVYFFARPNGPELFSQYYKPYYNVISDYRRGDEIKTDRYDQAFQFYERKEHAQAIREMTSLLEENPADQNLLFYLGLSYLAVGQVDSASSYLQKVMRSDNKLAEPAEWYLGLTYLNANDRENAVNVFSKISKSSSGYSDRARIILGKLK